MKQKDIAIIVLAVGLSGIISFFLSNQFFASPNDLKTKVEVVEPITADFPELDKRYYNSKSINPTQEIVIGDEKNQQPFQSPN
ncbi:MAG TPA: hypothetical protein PKB09_00970 [Candidatus Saccharibacteria bacterium]|nr:hypothetical protein [Candidatus Saccharibacteria bacterium]